MRIVSWNMGMNTVGRFKPGTHDRAWHYLLGLGPDIACLQEALPPSWVRNEGTLVQGPVTKWGSAIFSPRFPLDRYRIPNDSPLNALGSYLAYATALLPDGQEAFIASVHTPAKEATRAQLRPLDSDEVRRPSVSRPWVNDVAFAGLSRLVSSERFIFAGDWNTDRLFDRDGGTAGVEFFERARAIGWVECSRDDDSDLQTWFREGDAPYQLDHAFCDPKIGDQRLGIRVAREAAEVLGLSDHAPLVMDFDVKPISMASLES